METGGPRGPTDAQGASRFIESGDVRLHVLEYAPDNPVDVVVVPGITSPAITWEFVARELARDWHVHTLDLRGRGRSDTPPQGYRLPDYAEDLAAVVRSLGLKRPVILGHSLGARIASAFAVRHGDLRGPLIVADPPLSGPGRDPYPTPLESFLDSIAKAKAGATAADMRPYFPTWSDEQLELRARWLPTCDEHAVAESWRGFHDEDFFDSWPLVEPPVLFVYGGESPVVTERRVQEVAGANPRAQIARVEGAGHMIPWENLPGFLAEVRRFVSSVVP